MEGVNKLYLRISWTSFSEFRCLPIFQNKKAAIYFPHSQSSLSNLWKIIWNKLLMFSNLKKRFNLLFLWSDLFSAESITFSWRDQEVNLVFSFIGPDFDNGRSKFKISMVHFLCRTHFNAKIFSNKRKQCCREMYHA